MKELQQLNEIKFPDGGNLDVTYTYKDGDAVQTSLIEVPFASVNFTGFMELVCQKLNIVSINLIELFIYKAGQPQYEFNRRALVKLKGRTIDEYIIANIEPQTKLCNNVVNLIQPSHFSDEEITSIIDSTGMQIAGYIQNEINK